MSNSIIVATWPIAGASRIPAESAFLIGPVADAIETALEDDRRTVVKLEDIRPGGKYYSIVKLQMKYENQAADDDRYAMGTGWLIAPDLLVTAGHCAYDHQYGFGRAVEVKAYIGYHGKESINKPGVQFRHGVTIATTKAWIDGDLNRANDVSFIRVASPFQDVVPVKWEGTLTQGHLTLGVVGYPADHKDANGEKGAEMYEMWADTKFDLKSTASNMLEYHISTYAGQSGSPVLVQKRSTLTSIGAHVYGLGNRNSASTIRGQYGNDYGAYISTFSKTTKYPITASVAGVTYLEVPPQSSESDLEVEAEDFSDVLKKVVDVGAPMTSGFLKAGSPFLGPIGGPIAVAAGIALSAVNQLTQSEQPESESELAAQRGHRSYAAHAVLAEGALQTVLQMDHETMAGHRVLDYMKETFDQNKGHVGIVAQKLSPALLEPALRITIADSAPETGTKPTLTRYPVVGDKTAMNRIPDREQRQFVQTLSQAASATFGEEEDFVDFVTALATVATNVRPVAISGIASLFRGGEAGSEDVTAPPDSFQAHMEILIYRSLFAEAALQTLMAPSHQQQTEGFFNNIFDTVKKIGSTVVKIAPDIIKATKPIISSLGKESALDPLRSDKTGGQLAPPVLATGKQPSIADPVETGDIKRQPESADRMNDVDGELKALSATAVEFSEQKPSSSQQDGLAWDEA